MYTEEHQSLLALAHVPGVGHLTLRQLVAYLGSASEVLKAGKARLMKVPGIGTTVADALAEAPSHLAWAEKELQAVEKRGERILFFSDEAYPERLRLVNDAPAFLYVAGPAKLNNRRVVAIVGTRKSTEYGKRVVYDLLQGLLRHNALIVSGLAYGIDIAAHQAALELGLETVGVMATGIDKVYPAAHHDTARKMRERGALLTEQPLGTDAQTHYFPSRNRIIVGMADATIVVEAGAKGGALISADVAFGYNREVFAVPGPIYATASQGTNRLIADQKALCLTGIEDLEYALNWDLEKEAEVRQGRGLALNIDALSEEERTLGRAMSRLSEPHIDEIARAVAWPVGKVASLLLNMEFAGAIKALPGKKFTLTAAWPLNEA